MKNWKMVLALGIAGIFVLPILPATEASAPDIPIPTQQGDLVFAEGEGWFDLAGPDHVSAWDSSNNKIIEADPYYDVWGEFRAPWFPYTKLKYLYPLSEKCLKYLTHMSYNNPGTTWGRIESDTLQHDAWAYEWYKYYHVNGGNSWDAMGFARQKEGRPFDYYSPWSTGLDSKQMNAPSNDKMWYSGVEHDLGRGYYCSEIAWAAWKHGGVDLDTDSDAVMPQEIIDENEGGKISYYRTVNL